MAQAYGLGMRFRIAQSGQIESPPVLSSTLCVGIWPMIAARSLALLADGTSMACSSSSRSVTKLLLFDINLTPEQTILYYTLEANREA